VRCRNRDEEVDVGSDPHDVTDDRRLKLRVSRSARPTLELTTLSEITRNAATTPHTK
jgi:hypothetical protein